MKWITHQTGAALGSLALGLSLPAIGASVAGAVFPDMIDQSLSRLAPTKEGRQQIFNRIHRGPSHWFGWWLALFLAVLALPMPALARDIALGFAAGCLGHIALDMLTPRGVPFWPFSHKFKLALPICSTGSWREWAFLGAMLVCAWVFLRHEVLIQLDLLLF